jgi:hypothetical protein
MAMAETIVPVTDEEAGADNAMAAAGADAWPAAAGMHSARRITPAGPPHLNITDQ